MKILVITSCTKDKQNYEASAAEMYTGQQHRYVMTGLKQIRDVYGSDVVDLHIISAGYGLLSENKVIVPYDVTFGERKKEIIELSNNLQIHERVEILIADYDLVFFLLGEKYVQALQLPFEVPDKVTQIFLLGDTHRKLIPDLPNIHFVPAGKSLRNELSTTHTALKGFVFKKICERVCHDGIQVFEKIKDDPQLIPDIACST